MQVLFSTGALYGFPYPLAFRLAAAAGCDGVELVLDPWSLLAGPGVVKDCARRLRCPIHVLHPSLFGLPGWHRAPQAFPRLGEWALALECPLVVVHPPRFRDLARNTVLWDEGLEGFRRVTGGDVEITIENSAIFHPDDRLHPYVWPELVGEFARERGIRMTFDTTHAASTGLGLQAYESVADILAHIHLSDFGLPHRMLDRPSLDTYFKHHRMPGSGELGFPAWFRRLRADGYGGSITVEVSPVALQAWNPWAPRRVLAAGVDRVREWWTAAAAPATVARQELVEVGG